MATDIIGIIIYKLSILLIKLITINKITNSTSSKTNIIITNINKYL
jgi:hypothetical protein